MPIHPFLKCRTHSFRYSIEQTILEKCNMSIASVVYGLFFISFSLWAGHPFKRMTHTFTWIKPWILKTKLGLLQTSKPTNCQHFMHVIIQGIIYVIRKKITVTFRCAARSQIFCTTIYNPYLLSCDVFIKFTYILHTQPNMPQTFNWSVYNCSKYCTSFFFLKINGQGMMINLMHM